MKPLIITIITYLAASISASGMRNALEHVQLRYAYQIDPTTPKPELTIDCCCSVRYDAYCRCTGSREAYTGTTKDNTYSFRELMRLHRHREMFEVENGGKPRIEYTNYGQISRTRHR
jgi:hypothetical protein